MPVYNAEKYIENAVHSVINQNFKDFELLLVDDASTDKSRLLCDKMADEDSRICAIHKENNEGVGDARNTGIKYSKGEYIFFIDSDDTIDTNMLGDLYDNLRNNKCDMVICGYYESYYDERNNLSNEIVCIPQATLYTSKLEIRKDFIYLDFLTFARFPWNKLYSKRLIIDNNLIFPRQPLGEDIMFNIDAMGCSERIQIIDKAYYHYSIRKSNSLTKTNYDIFEYLNRKYEKELNSLIMWGCSTDANRILLARLHLRSIMTCIDSVYHSSIYQKKEKIKRVENIIYNKNTQDCVCFLNCFPIREKILYLPIRLNSISLSILMEIIIFRIKKIFPFLFKLIKKKK